MIKKFFIFALFLISCKYNVSSPVDTLKDYSNVDLGVLHFVDSTASIDDIEDSIELNRKSLSRYIIAMTGSLKGNSALVNIKTILEKSKYSDRRMEITLVDASLDEIPSGIFNGHKNLYSIVLPDDTTVIKEGAFQDCTSLENVKFSKSLITIEKNAFKNNTSLVNIYLPNHLETINEGAFENCTSLKNLLIPAFIKNLDNNIFSGCSSLYNVEYIGIDLIQTSNKPLGDSTPTYLYLSKLNADGTEANSDEMSSKIMPKVVDWTKFLNYSWKKENIIYGKTISNS